MVTRKNRARAKSRRLGPSRQQGHALVLALLVLLLSATSLAVLSQALLAEWGRARSHAQRVRTLALADAALAETLAQLAQQPGFRGIPEREQSGGNLTTEVTPEGPPRPDGQQIRIEVWSETGGLEQRYIALARLQDGRAPVVLQWRPRAGFTDP